MGEKDLVRDVRFKGGMTMNHEKIPDPTADRAIGRVDRQSRLEKKHGVKVGENITLIYDRTTKAQGKKLLVPIKVRITDVSDHWIRVRLPWGIL